MSQIESHSRVLEDGTQGLLSGSELESTVDSDAGGETEFANLDELKPAPAEKPAAVVAAPAVKKPAAAAAPEGEGELPEELKGKTPAQLAKMYRDAQTVIGRQGSELGEFRKKADMLIQASLASIQASRAQPAAKPEAQQATPPAPLEDSEFFAKPQDAVSRMIENHPIIKEIRATLGKSEADSAVSRARSNQDKFNAAHPDSAEILAKPEFRQWLAASPVRRELMKRAHERYDFEAGDEVFSTWKALQGRKPEATPSVAATAAPAGDVLPTEAEVKAAAQTLARAKNVKAAHAAAASAALAPTGGASAGKAPTSGKIYRRADVLRLMEEDPDRYEALSDELTKAYAENRVR